MLELISTAPEVPRTTFDGYVPAKVEWPAYPTIHGVPTYILAREDSRLLEMKFDPTTSILVELILVTVAGIRETPDSFAQAIEDADVIARWNGPNAEIEHLQLVAYRDCVVATLTTEKPTTWKGRGPIFFGVTTSGTVGAIGVRWATPGERERLLL